MKRCLTVTEHASINKAIPILLCNVFMTTEDEDTPLAKISTKKEESMDHVGSNLQCAIQQNGP